MLAVVLVARTCLEPAWVPGSSMEPTLLPGDWVLLNKIVFGAELTVPFTTLSLGRFAGLRGPRVGDIVALAWPSDLRRQFLKRVVAVGGQTLELRGQRLFVDGRPVAEPYARYAPEAGVQSTSFGPCTVPAGAVFVMGDSRSYSLDSRTWGPVPVAQVSGLALRIYWSWSDTSARLVRWERIGRRP